MDIIQSWKGLTVEIGNTDAEGWLVLADTLTYTQEHYNPKRIIDLATLTGAVVVGLGDKTAGIFSNNEELADSVIKSSKEMHESCWKLPIFDHHWEDIKPECANLSNTGKSRYGGACTAAAFLEAFIDKDWAWVHMDIAGPAMAKAPCPPMPAGGTGFGTLTLLDVLRGNK